MKIERDRNKLPIIEKPNTKNLAEKEEKERQLIKKQLWEYFFYQLRIDKMMRDYMELFIKFYPSNKKEKIKVTK